MIFTKTRIPGLIIIEPKVFKDERGCFFESYNQQVFDKNYGPVRFVQDNESKSVYGVLRGFHFQKPPFAQAKLVRCTDGEVLDVALDVRKNSPYFGQHVAVKLTAENKKQLFIPRGFAHAFLALSSEGTVVYKVDSKYAPEYDSGVIWNDPALGVDWNISETEAIIAQKDLALKPLSETDSGFEYLCNSK